MREWEAAGGIDGRVAKGGTRGARPVRVVLVCQRHTHTPLPRPFPLPPSSLPQPAFPMCGVPPRSARSNLPITHLALITLVMRVATALRTYTFSK